MKKSLAMSIYQIFLISTHTCATFLIHLVIEQVPEVLDGNQFRGVAGVQLIILMYSTLGEGRESV